MNANKKFDGKSNISQIWHCLFQLYTIIVSGPWILFIIPSFPLTEETSVTENPQEP